MATLTSVNLGSAADAGDGDPLRTAFGHLNDNDDALNTELALKLTALIQNVAYPGDADFVVDGEYRSIAIEYSTALTTPHTVTLSSTNAQQNDVAFIYRTDAATGSNLSVTGFFSAGSSSFSLNNVNSFLMAVFDGATNKWRIMAWVDGSGGGSSNASGISFTPAGNIAATDVQAALEEVDSEKLATSAAATVATSGDYDDLTNLPILGFDDTAYAGDANYSVDGGARKLALEYDTTLTTTRTVSLVSNGSAQTGDMVCVYRTANCTGSPLTVSGFYSAGTGTKSLNTPGSFLIAVYDGGTNKWRLLVWLDQLATDQLATNAVDNTKLSNMAGWTIKARNQSSTGDPEDVAKGNFAEEGSPAGGMKLVGFLSTGELRVFDVGNLPTGGGGEANTASNVGTDGVGVFKQKTGVNLEFKNVAPASSKLSVAANGDDIDLDVVEANLAVTASQISDSTAAGRTLLTATDAAEQRDDLEVVRQLHTNKDASAGNVTGSLTDGFWVGVYNHTVTRSLISPTTSGINWRRVVLNMGTADVTVRDDGDTTTYVTIPAKYGCFLELNNSGLISGERFPLDGAIGALAALDEVALSNMADLAERRVIGRAVGAGTGVPTDLDETFLRTIIGEFAAGNRGLVPDPTSSSGRFLKDDATWSSLGSGTYNQVDDSGNYSASAFVVGTDGAETDENRRFTGNNAHEINFPTGISADAFGAFHVLEGAGAYITSAATITVNGQADRGGANSAINIYGDITWWRNDDGTFEVRGDTDEATTQYANHNANNFYILNAELLNYRETRSAPSSSSGTLTLNVQNGNCFEVTLTENVSTLTLSNASSGRIVTVFLILKQNGSGGFTFAWPGSVKWAGGTAPTVTSTANAVDIYTLITPDGGTNWYGFEGGQDFS